MSESLTQENTPDLAEILSELHSLRNKVTNLEEKLKLVSDINRYSQLQEFLKAGNFKEADK